MSETDPKGGVQGSTTLRQAQVFSHFLKSFGALYPQFAFRGLRRFPSRSYEPYGLALRVAFGRAGIEMELLCVALTDGSPQEVKRFVQRIRRAPIEPLSAGAVSTLLAPYFSEEARALCREAGVGYFDLAGNAGLDTPHVFFEMLGKANTHVRERQVEHPFEGKAERVTRRLLLEPEKRWNLRALAHAAQVSLGLASMVTTALVETGVMAKNRRGVELLNPPALLEAWAQSYDLRRSALRVYRSRAGVSELQTRLAEQRGTFQERYALTLWSGAQRWLAEDNPASRLALYWAGKPERLAQVLSLDRDQGTTFVFAFHPYDESVFWGADEAIGPLPVVHPLQLYLDLGSGDEEELGLAQRVRARLLPW